MHFQCLILVLLVFRGAHTIEQPFKFIAKPFKLDRDYNMLDVHRKDTFTVSCETNDKSAKVDLKHFKKSINKTYEDFDGRLTRSNQTFTIKHVTLNDHGEYTCFASNGTNEINLTLGIIYVRRAPCIEETRWNDRHDRPVSMVVEVEMNDILKKFKCLAIGGQSCEHTLSLVKINGTNHGTTLKFRSCYDKIINGMTYDIGIFEISKPIAGDAGVYRCRRKVPGCKHDQQTHADMTIKYKQPYAPIIWKRIPKIRRARERSSLTLRCNVSASPAPNISWVDESGSDVKTCSGKFSCEHEVSNVRRYNNTYFCRATNVKGNDSATVEIDVLILPKVQLVPYHKKRKFECVVLEGNPPPSITWEKCGALTSKGTCNNTSWKRVYDDGIHIKIFNSTDEGKNLSTINFFQASQSGYYRCGGENDIGRHVSGSMWLQERKYIGHNSSIIIGLICGFALVCSIFIVIMYYYRKYIQEHYAPDLKPNDHFQVDKNRTIFQQSIELPYDWVWEFPRHRVNFIKVIGSGAFGEVWEAEARGIDALCPLDKSFRADKGRKLMRLSEQIPEKILGCLVQPGAWNKVTKVAAKTLKDEFSPQEYKDLASEIKVLIYLGCHKNIVNILGACTHGGKLIALMEFCPGDNLTNFLKARRDIFSGIWRRKSHSTYDEDFSLTDIAYAVLQIARGMAFLSSKKLVHRDLAARNILVHDNFVLKIADFGLARNVRKNDVYYKKGGGLLPMKWMAPESIFETRYTTKSDVWSFGIVLWEICTMGGSPYPGIKMEEVADHLRKGYRMSKPESCPDELYDVMRLCWEDDPEARPHFSWFETQLESIISAKRTDSNLATFDERLKSLSSETDYLVQLSPVRRNSFDQFLESKREPTTSNIKRKMSADVLTSTEFNFPSSEDVFVEESCNNVFVEESSNNYADEKKNQDEYVITDRKDKNVTDMLV